MKLSESGLKKLTEFLGIVLNVDCPLCLGVEWDASEDILQLTPYSGKSQVHGGNIVPILLVSCHKCGYTFMFNALKTGILEIVPKNTYTIMS